MKAADCSGCLGYSGPPCGCTCHNEEDATWRTTMREPLFLSNAHAAEALRLAGRYDDGSTHAGTLAMVEATLAVAQELAELRAALERRMFDDEALGRQGDFSPQRNA